MSSDYAIVAIEMHIGGEITEEQAHELLGCLKDCRVYSDWQQEAGPATIKELRNQAFATGYLPIFKNDGTDYEIEELESTCLEMGLFFHAWVDSDHDGIPSVRYPQSLGGVSSGTSVFDVCTRRVDHDRNILILHADLEEDLSLHFVSVAEMKRTLTERFMLPPEVPCFKIVEG